MSKITKNQFPKKLTIFAKIDFCKTFVHVSHSQRSVAYDNNLDYYVLFISIVDLEKKNKFRENVQEKNLEIGFPRFCSNTCTFRLYSFAFSSCCYGEMLHRKDTSRFVYIFQTTHHAKNVVHFAYNNRNVSPSDHQIVQQLSILIDSFQ